MKNLIILFTLIFSQQVYSKTYSKMFNIVYKNKLYYSSYVFLKKSIQKKQKLSRGKINRVLDTIHPSVFIHDFELDEFTNKKTKIDYAVAVRRFFLNDFVTAKKKLLGLSKRNPLQLESNYILGLIYLTEKNFKKAGRHFKRCIRYSRSKKRSKLKPESYVRTFRNRCVQQIARAEFTKKNFKKAIKTLDYVRKDDYIWPRFLLDRAWSYYWLGENERALGTVLTYRAPLLRRFMVPEANYLRGLIYYEMCYFEKAENVYKEFLKTTWKYRKIAKTASRNRLLKLIGQKKEPKNNGDKFLYYYLKGYKKDIRYYTYNHARKTISDEIKKLSKIKSMRQAQIFLDSLYYYKSAIKRDFQDFLKDLSEDYYLQIRQMRSALVKLNLLVSLKKRKLLSKGKGTDLKDEIFEKSLSQISNVDEKFIWSFEGGFWADELGDYAVALENRCGK